MRFILSLFEGNDAPSWSQIALQPLKENANGDLMYKYTPGTIKKKTDNPIVKHLVRTWHETHRTLGMKIGLSPKTPLNQNKLIPMTVDNKNLDSWHQKGIQRLEDYYDDGGLFLSYEQLKAKYNLSHHTFYTYLQVRSFLRAQLGPEMIIPEMSGIAKFLHEGNTYKFMSRMYTLLMKEGPKPGFHNSRLRWESALGVTIDDRLWTDLCRDSLSTTINTRYRMINYNILHQLYLTPEKIHSFKPELSDICFRCNTETGTFIHCTWQCTKVIPFWHEICSILTIVTGVKVPPDPELCLLGNMKHICGSLKKAQQKFIQIALSVAKKCIAISWKSDSLLVVNRWSSELNSCIPMEKITYSVKKQHHKFLKIWQPYLDYINKPLTSTT